MQKNVASQKWVVFAFDETDNTAVTGDAANITGNLRIDGGAADAIDDTNPTELEDGYYIFDLTQGETNGDYILICPQSSTADVQVIGVPGAVWTTPPNFNDMGIEADGDLTKVNSLDGQTVQSGDAYAIVNNGTYGNSAIETLVDELETRLTAVRAGYLDELAAANLPADVDTLLSRLIGTILAGNHTAQSGDAYSRIGVNGAGLSNIDLPNQIMDITGNLSGSVGSVTNPVETDAASRTASQADVSNLDVAVSTRSSHAAADIWAVGARTLTSFGTLVADVATAVWGAVARTLTSGAAPSVVDIRTEMDTNSTKLIDIIADTNELQTDDIPGRLTTVDGNIALIPTTMRGTDNAALDATVAKEATLADVKITTDKLDDTLENDLGVYRFTANALEEAPGGAGGDATEANQTIIVNHLLGVKGGGWLEGLHSQVATVNRGNVAWITGGGAAGSNTVTLTIDDGTNPVQDASVQIWNSAATALVTYIDSDINGLAVMTADDGNYKVKIRKGGYSFSIEDLVVSGDTATTYSGSTIIPPAPADPDVCRIYSYFKKADTIIPVSAKGIITIIGLPYHYDGSTFSGAQLPQTYNQTTGLIYWDVVRLATIRIQSTVFGIDKTATVPDVAMIEIKDL